MHISRLFEMVHLLLGKKQMTAKDLASHFEVSTRTIYRDVDTLSAAGIPIYATKGNGGGIGLLDNYVLNKALLSKDERTEILASLQGIQALGGPDVNPTLKKLSSVFTASRSNWIDVDFSNWGAGNEEREKFSLLKTAILETLVITFDYYGTSGEHTLRRVEPLKLFYKGHAWYIYAYCQMRGDYRFFRVTRMKSIVCLDDTFDRDMPNSIWDDTHEPQQQMITVVLNTDASLSHRVYDECDPSCITPLEKGRLQIKMTLPENEWLYGYILSYGSSVEVLEPAHLRTTIKERLALALKRYDSTR